MASDDAPRGLARVWGGRAKPTPALAVIATDWPQQSLAGASRLLEGLAERGLRFEVWTIGAPPSDLIAPRRAFFSGQRMRPLPPRLGAAPVRVLRGLAYAVRSPGFRAAFEAWSRQTALSGRPTRARLRAFGQAAVLARELPEGVNALYADRLGAAGEVARLAALLAERPWGVGAEAGDAFKTPSLVLRDLMREARLALASSRAVAAHLAAHAPQPARIAMAPQAVDLARLPTPPLRRRVRGELRMVTVGRLEEKLGVDRLIEALARLPAEIRWRWRHVGGGPLTARMRRLAAQVGLGDRAAFVGPASESDVIDELRWADVFVLPGRVARDGDRGGALEMALLAASQKLPLLATPESGVEEIVEAEATGVFSEDAPEVLARALAELARAPERRSRMGEEAYARVRSGFDLSRTLERIAPLLQELGGARPIPRPAPSLFRRAGA